MFVEYSPAHERPVYPPLSLSIDRALPDCSYLDICNQKPPRRTFTLSIGNDGRAADLRLSIKAKALRNIKSNAILIRECRRSARLKLNSILDGESNSFNVIRLAAALLVVVSHSFEIPFGRDAIQPLDGPTPFNLGAHAVNAFFIISGLTLSNSVARNPDLVRFLRARVLRIFPGLIAFGVIFSFGLGPLVTIVPLDDYFSDLQTYLYPLVVLVAFGDAVPPHGVFVLNPVAGVVNDPLWTIRYELAAYLGLAILVATGLFRKPLGLISVCLAVTAYFALFEIYPDLGGEIHGYASIARFSFCFMLGVVAFVLRNRIILSPAALVGASVALWLLSGTVFARAAYLVFTAYLVFVLAAYSFGPLTRWTRKTDISYGIYLYGWPIQQTAILVAPGLGVYGLIALTFVLAPVAGWLSWTYVEKPAMALKLARRPVRTAAA